MSEPSREACLTALCLELRNFVGSFKKAIDGEIRAYPKPIPRCDAQFNFLYERRASLALVLARTASAEGPAADPGELADILAQFAASAPLTEDAAEQSLRHRIGAELSRREPPFSTTAHREAGGALR